MNYQQSYVSTPKITEMVSFARVGVSFFPRVIALAVPSCAAALPLRRGGLKDIDEEVAAQCGLPAAQCRELLERQGFAAGLVGQLYRKAYAELFIHAKALLQNILPQVQELNLMLWGADFAGLTDLAVSCLHERGQILSAAAFPAPACDRQN